jgi:class 3 adenylate cyclase
MQNTDENLLKELQYYKQLADELGGNNISYDARIAAATTELRKFKEGLDLLNKLQQSIDVKDSIQAVFESTMQAINTKLRMDKSVILTESEKDTFTPAYSLGFDETFTEGFGQIKVLLPGQLLRRDDYWLVTKANPAADSSLEVSERLNIPFFIAVPVFIHQKRFGVLVSGRMKEIRPFLPPLSPIDAELFQTIGAFLSVSATNSGSYNILEKLVEERTRELTIEKEKSDRLLLNVLPEEVANELKEKGEAKAKLFDHVTVMFTDFVGFTTAAERLSPENLVLELHTCFKAFDEIVSKYGIEKIKTIGDSFLAVAGLPMAEPGHAENMVKAAIEIVDFIEKRRLIIDTAFNIRVGIHSGNVVAGIVGVKKFAYDIWGDTVNTAARMEQNSEGGKINISGDTYQLIKEKFDCTYRGKIPAKNKGEIDMYFLNR